jgi:hypothetical protein
MSQANYVSVSKLTVDDFINESGLDFTDISTEAVRRYHYKGDTEIVISGPLMLNVSRSGGHRIFDENGVSHYIPKGWIQLTWIAKPGEPNFVK